MERKIGEIFKFHDTFLQVWEAKESDGCNGCFFEEYYPLCLPHICTAQEREDGKNVQFKEIIKTMTTEETKVAVKVMEAYANGKKIQYLNGIDGWVDTSRPVFNWAKYCYRVKPEPKCRPFKSQEECWQEMHKHPDFGWVKYKDSKSMYHIRVIGHGYILIDGADLSFFEAFDKCEFFDGTPFGIMEE